MMLTLFTLLFCQSGDLDQALQQARRLADSGDYARAIATLREAGAERSGSVEALHALGTYLLRATEARAASGELQGLAVYDAFGEAAAVLRRASGLPGAPGETFENWSEALLNSNDPDNALRAVEAGLERHAHDLRLMLQKGRVQAAKAAGVEGDEPRQRELRSEAAATFKAAMEAHSQSGLAAVRFGEMQVYLGDMQAARAAWKEALRRNAAEVDLGSMGAWLQSNNAAADLLAEYNASAPEDASRLWFQAFYEYNAQPRRWADAKRHFERALELNPDFSSTWYFLGEGAMAEGARLAEGKEMAAAHREYRYAAGAWAKYLEVAGAHQAQQVRALPDGGESFLETMTWLAGTAYDPRNPGAAGPSATIAGWVAQLRPQDVEAWNNYAFFLRESGQPERSLQAYRQALSLRPDDPQIMNDLAVILHYYLKKDDEEATKLYERAIERAEALLADPGALDTEERGRIQTALRDARNNLAKLKEGIRVNF